MAEADVSTPPEGTQAPSAPPAPPPSSNGLGAPPAEPGQYAALDWRSGLPQELRGDPQINKTLENYPNQATFVRDALNWRRHVSQSVRLPGEQATPEDWQSFYKQLPGWADTPNAYVDAITLPPLAPEGQEAPVDWDPRLLQDIYSTAHAHGIRPVQLQPILETYARHLQQALNVEEANASQRVHEQELELQRRLGGNVRSETTKARQFFQRLTGDTELGLRVWQKMVDVGLGNDADTVQFYALASERWGEPPDLLSDGLFPVTPTRDEIESERSKLVTAAFDQTKSPEERKAAAAKLQGMERHALSLRR